METRRIDTLDDLRIVAEEILMFCMSHDSLHVIALSGNLGAGKTAFVKELARVLGIQTEVTSPTFVIMKSYPISAHTRFHKLTHIDAYRVESDNEMSVLGFEMLVHDSKQLICIEWPEKIQDLLPRDILHVKLVINQDCSRSVSYGV